MAAAPSGPPLSSDDLAVQSTNVDATSCKRYAVERGYWSDQFIKYFYRATERRSPEISRGYYARVKSVHLLLHQFLALTDRRCQFVSFGAGFDTLYWLLWKQGQLPTLFIEVDFQGVTTRKSQVIRTQPKLSEALSNPTFNIDTIHSDAYHLLPGDLRDIPSLSQQLFSAGLDPSLPTFFLAECVMVYMEGEKAKDLIRWAGENFKTAIFLNYDPVNPFDRFGSVMKENLKSRGCSLLGISSCPDVASQKQRYHDNGWKGAWSLDMAHVYSLLPHSDIHRIERIDFLDEQELLVQLLQHYCLSCGYSDRDSIGLADIKLDNHHTRHH